MAEKSRANDVRIPMPGPEEGSHPFSVTIQLGSSVENLRYRTNIPSVSSPSKEIASSKPSTTQKAPTNKSTTPQPAREEDEDKDNPDGKESENRGKWTFSVIFEWVVFVCFVGFLITSTTVHMFKNYVIWGLELWKWCVLVLVFFCGRMFTGWMMNVLVFVISGKFVRHEKLLYFVYGVRKSVRFFVWLCLVLLAWALLFDGAVKRSDKTTKILNYITKALVSSLLGAFIWMLKTLFVKSLASHFQCNRFFQRIRAAILHQHIVEVLSRPSSRGKSDDTSIAHKISEFLGKKEGKREDVVNWIKKLKQEKTSALTMKGLIDVIGGTKLIIADTEDDGGDRKEKDGDVYKQKDNKITSNRKAEHAAYEIFCKVIKKDQGFIQKDDLSSYFDEKDVVEVFQQFSKENENITLPRLKNWMVDVYHERQALVASLKDSKTAIEELNRLLSALVLIVIIVVWLLMMGVLNTKGLVFISSQLLLTAFMFGNTFKMIFEAIIFVFVVHPFDVNDRCVIDGVQMIVEEMNLLTTVFLKYDKEKIYYPNSVLATKPIGNFYRSPPEMGDAVEFAIDVSTPVDKIETLDKEIKKYMKSKSEHWGLEPSLVVKDFDDVNKIKMALYFSHTINFQNYGDKTKRRSDLILELKKILDNLEIKYHMLPLEARIIGNSSLFPPRF